MNDSTTKGPVVVTPNCEAQPSIETVEPRPIDADEVMRMVEEYGVLRGTAAKLADLGLLESAGQRDLEASMLRDKIRKAVTR